MLSIYQLKPRFQKTLQPISSFLYRSGITANEVTIAAVCLSLGMGFAFLFYPVLPIVLLLVPFGLLLRMALNALDGMMARQYQMQSKKGELLNEVGDVVSDLLLIFPLLVIPSAHTGVIVLFAILTLLNEFAGLLGKAIGGARRYDGPMGKSDRALLIGVFCLTYYYWGEVEIYINWIFGIACLLLVVSTFTRFKNALKTVHHDV